VTGRDDSLASVRANLPRVDGPLPDVPKFDDHKPASLLSAFKESLDFQHLAPSRGTIEWRKLVLKLTWYDGYRQSSGALGDHSLGVRDCTRRVEVLWAALGAIHDRVAAIEPERVLQPVEALPCPLISAVREPPVGLQQD
jgi:hypothetical protein